MKSQTFKDAIFSAISPATQLNHLLWKLRYRLGIRPAPKQGQGIWLNVGSGGKPHNCFINIDGNPLRWPEMWLDLRNGLPFPSGSVDKIYASHVLEHFFWKDLIRVMAEFERVLRPGGGVRMLVPSVEMAVEAYLRQDRDWFRTFPTPYDSLGGRLSNFLFCDGQHRLAFDYSFAKELFARAGFGQVARFTPAVSEIFPESLLAELEPEIGYIKSSLIVEAVKGQA